MSLDSGSTRARRRPSLTPMIDVVFLLRVFFTLAARFSVDCILPLDAADVGGCRLARSIRVDRG